MFPAIDHSGLSTSGRVSKAARKAWEKREYARLFPPGTFDVPQPTDAEKIAAQIRSIENILKIASPSQCKKLRKELETLKTKEANQ